MLAQHHIPPAGSGRRNQRTAEPAPPPPLPQARVVSHRPQSGLVLGHHQALGAGHLGPAKWTYFYIYVILDIFSRYVVGWMVAPQESAALAQRLLSATCKKQGIIPGQLAIHADRGPSMKSKPVAFLAGGSGGHQNPQPPPCLQ
jgi:transposase InsO family protein